MEPLALLCNLYGDGPATLRRLQRAGCDSLAALVELDVEELAARTGWDVAAADRFLREAWLTAERLDLGLIEAEARSLSYAEEGPAPSAPLPVEPRVAPSALDLRPEDRHDVLGRWQELDRSDPPGLPEDELRPHAPPGRRPGHPLESAFLPGLLPEHLAALRERGLGTLEAFAEVPAIGLARELGIGYTRLARWQFLARRALAETFEPRPSARQVILEPREPPGSGRLDAGGPFA